MRKVARAIRLDCDERLAKRTRIVRELYDTMLQTIQASKFVADDALEKSNDIAHMQLALKKLSSWLEEANREGQVVLNSLSTANVEKHHNPDRYHPRG